MAKLYNQYTQLFPPKPQFTDKNLGDLSGKVYIITGSNTGLGKELAAMLYAHNATIYIAARSQEKSITAISSIQKSSPKSTGKLSYLHLDLADLTTISASAREFLSKEKQLHVLFNNAGVMLPAAGSKTVQGYDLQLGVNNVGTFAFTQLLTPILVSTAKSSPANTVRVVWVSSSAAEGMAPKGGIPLDNLDYKVPRGNMYKYAVSKAGNYYQGTEFAKRYVKDGVVSVSLNPGNLASDLWRTQGRYMSWFLNTFILHPPVYGAYTELYAGLSPDITLDKTGMYVAPWGRKFPVRDDLLKGSKNETEGATGVARKFWQWQEEQVKQYL